MGRMEEKDMVRKMLGTPDTWALHRALEEGPPSAANAFQLG